MQVAHKRLLDDPTLDQRTPDEIISLLKLCLNATCFAFRDLFYQQVHGTAMGSLVSVVIADLVMEDVEHRALRTYPNPPKFWKRYVDDTCCILRSDLVDDFHNHVNTIKATIKLTFEIEAKSQLPSLDIFYITLTSPLILQFLENQPILINTWTFPPIIPLPIRQQ